MSQQNSGQHRVQLHQRPIQITLPVALAVVFSSVAAIFLVPKVAAVHAACSGHCYGSPVWNGAIHGGETFVETVDMSGTTSNHISDEEWITDLNHGCFGATVSWVEMGQATRLSDAKEYYFWVDCRPGYQYFEHWVSTVPSGDVGHYFYYLIKYLNSTTYNLYLMNSSGGVVWSAQSTSNTMQPNRQQIGLETTSTSATSASSAYFKLTEWERPNGAFSYQTNPGTVTQASPPYWTWDQPPNSSNQVGLGHSRCC